MIVLDPQREHVITAATHHSAMDTNIYEGMRVRGKVVTTISRGRVVWHEGKLDVAAGSGRFIAMPPFAPSLFGVAPTRAPRHEVEARRYGTVPVQRPSASGEAASSAAPHAEL